MSKPKVTKPTEKKPEPARPKRLGEGVEFAPRGNEKRPGKRHDG